MHRECPDVVFPTACVKRNREEDIGCLCLTVGEPFVVRAANEIDRGLHTCLDLRMAERTVAGVIPRCYGNYTCRLLENFVPRCDQWIPLSQISSSNAQSNLGPNPISPNIPHRAT
jgi:hypothetical protein